jgi:hypothetical protein
VKTVDQVHFNKWCLPFWALAAACRVPALMGREVFLVLAVVSFVAASSLTYMRVTDEIDELSVRFGPFPIMGTSIPYDLIESVDVAPRIPFTVAPVLIPGVVGIFAARRGVGVRIRLKRRFTIGRTGLLLAPVYLVQTHCPDEVVSFIRRRLGESGQGYEYGAKHARPVLLALAVALPVVVVGCFAPPVLLVAGALWFMTCLVLVMRFALSVRIRGFGECLIVKPPRFPAVSIAYSEMESVARCPTPRLSGATSGVFREASSPEGILIKLKGPIRLGPLELWKVKQVIVATQDPDGLYEFLRSKLPAQPEQE